MDGITTKIWVCSQELADYSKTLYNKGRKESSEGLDDIVRLIETLIDFMEDHPNK